MELLCQLLMDMPVDAVGLQGLIQLIFVSTALILVIMVPAPKKTISNNRGQ